MKPPLYQQLLNLFDLTDELTRRIDQDDSDIRSYFITLVSIENMFDTYARGLVRESAIDEGKNDEEASALLHQANERMDQLRLTIRKLAQAHDFDELLKEYGNKMYEDWHRLPDDHPNLQH